MAEPFIGEIRMFAGNFAPRGNAFADGQLLAINQNEALFSLLGTTYGGDGRTTFALPDLRGRVGIHEGTGPGLSPHNLGSKGGVELVVLKDNQLPVHTHQLKGSTATATEQDPPGNMFGSNAQTNVYTTDFTPTAMAAAAISEVGNDQPHNNLQPFLVIHFIVALFGIFPARN